VSLGLVACLLLDGCASNRQGLVLEPIGPVSGGRAGLFADGGDGYLRVHSATRQVNDGGIDYYPHTPYTVYSQEGRHVKGVQNHVGSDDQRPMTVPLPPGRYVVYALAEGWGRVTVPVTIVAGRLTVVFLAGKGLPEAPELPKAEVIWLPDGRAAGRRAPAPPALPLGPQKP
jgi:hypothetical protein